MNHQKHIINKQILEIHLPQSADVFQEQQKLSKLYREEWIPILDSLLSKRYGGTEQKTLQIDKLTIDLGVVQMEDLTTVFEEKLKEVLEEVQVSKASTEIEEENKPDAEKTPLRVLAYFLKTGLLPWWAKATTNEYLLEQLNSLLEEPNTLFKTLIREVGQKKEYLNRFLNTFSEDQINSSLHTITGYPIEQLPKIKQEIITIVLNNPEWFAKGLTAKKITTAFWSTVFIHVATTTNHSDLMRYSIQQTLRTVGADFPQILKEISEKQPNLSINKWIDVKTSTSVADQNTIYQQLRKIKAQHPENAVLQALCSQLSQMLNHPLFTQIDARQIQILSTILKNLVTSKGEVLKDRILKVVTETNLEPFSKHLQKVETHIKQIEAVPSSNVMERLHSEFDATDCITVQNAGLVLLWPFLQRFFENLALLNHKEFNDEFSKNKAACLLHYIVDEDEGELFEGLLPLNKVLCGIPLSDTIALEPLRAEEKTIIEGLLEAVISKGQHWKNLSIAGFRTSYLQREGLLRSRDGHWLLQVKKETYDITLEKVPWGFNTVKLPWMNEIILVEWI